MTEHIFTHGDKKLLTKFLRFISKNIIHIDGKYRLNFNLETFNPFSADNQSVQQRLGEIVHALGFSVRYPRRTARGQAVPETCEDIFFQHVRNLPETIEMELQGIEEGRQQQLIHQVLTDVVENSPARSLEVNYLKPYMAQEGLQIGPEDATVSFGILFTRFKALLEVLQALTSLHEIIYDWSVLARPPGVL